MARASRSPPAKAGIAATIVVPQGNSVEKNAAMRAFGAELIEAGHDFDAARETALRLAEERGLVMVPSFHRDLVRGVATYALELFRAAPPLDTVYVPIGLGSGICGVIAMRDALSPSTKVVGVVSTEAPAYALSFAAGKVVATNSANTMADGMAVRGPDAEALAVILKGADRIVQVSDAEIAVAMRAYYEDTHQLTEGAGAASLAALLQERERMKGKRVGAGAERRQYRPAALLAHACRGLRRRRLRHRRPGEVALDRLHDEGRARAADAGHAQQRLQGEVAEACEIGRQHMQQEIHVARHGVAGHDFGPRADRRLERLDGLLGVIVERDLHQGLQAKSHRRRRDQRGVARDDPFLLQPLDPPLAGRGGKADPVREIDDRQAALGLQGGDDASVYVIQADHGVFTLFMEYL